MPKPVPFKFCRYNVLGLCIGKATRDEYFEHLCKTEAGEYVFKRVEGVEGVGEVRPRRSAREPEELHDPHLLEDPLTSAADGTFTSFRHDASLGESLVQPPLGQYSYYDFYSIETGIPKFVHFYRDPNADPEGKRTLRRLNEAPIKWVLQSRETGESSARYRVVFRGSRRDRDREFRIAAQEIILIDSQANEILAVRRDFARSSLSQIRDSGMSWFNSSSCLRSFEATGRQFLVSVLVPMGNRAQ